MRPSCTRALTFARAAIAAVAVLSLPPSALAGTFAWPWRGADYPPPATNLRGAAAEILARAIRIDTTNPPGNERPLAEFLVEVAKREGLEARLVPTPSVAAPEGRAAAWARVSGTGSRRPIVLLSHLDVVPSRRDQWAVDPYKGVIGGGFVVGRGALDAKGIAIVHLLTLAELERRHVQLDRDVIFLAVPDEETGGRLGSAVVVRDRPELLGDAEFLLTEGGGVLPGRREMPDIWQVTFTEKSPCWVELTARGLPGHGASAQPATAVPRLVRALDRVRRHETPIRVVPEVAAMFAALAPLVSRDLRSRYGSLSTALELDPAFRADFLASSGHAALVRDTVAMTVLRGSESTNIVPAEATAELDARLLPGSSCPDFVADLRRVIDDPGIELSILLSFQGGASPVDTELFRAIQRVAVRRDPTASVVAQVNAGFTDAHYYRERGIVAYGFVPRWLRPIDTRGIHGPNERISLDNLELGIDTMVDIILELAELP